MAATGVLIFIDFRAKRKISGKLKQFHSQLNGEKVKVSETLDKLIRSEEKYRTLVDNSLQGMLVVQRGKVSFANPTIETITKYSIEEIRQTGRRWLNLLIHPDDKSRAYKNVRNALAGNKFESRQLYKIRQKDGDTRIMETLSTVVPYRDNPAMLIVAIDVTDQIKAREKLQQSEQKLRELNATKDKFFSILAHDLKNPFSSIIGLANLLREAYDDLTDAQRKEFVRDICTASEHTFKLLQNLLDWSGTQTGSYGFLPELLPIGSILKETVEMLKPAFDRKEMLVTINAPDEAVVFADENMLRLVIRNLLSNALKFSNRGGKVELQVLESEKETTIRVKDYGIGITKQNLENLFRIDKQIRTAGTEDETGTGLGLILSKEFVKINNGSIFVESEPDKGSLFTLVLPRSAPEKVSQ
jgi:PAS domain S-box-containing protein